jgi:RND family efflux transporter MFP subunit
MMKKNSILPLVIAAAIMTVSIDFSSPCLAQESTSPSKSVAVREIAGNLSVPVYLVPYRSPEISSVDSGVIGEILVKLGQRVQKGQELIKLDLDVLEAQLAVVEAQAQGKGRIMAAEADFDLQNERLQKLLELPSNRTNQSEIARQRATTISTQGLLLAAQEEVAIFELSAARIRAEIERRILRSPIDGVVVEIVKEVAESVSTMRSQSGEPDYLIRVVQLDVLKTLAHLPYSSARHMEVGDAVKVSTETESGEETIVTGVVEFVSPIIKGATRTIEVRLRIDNEKLLLRGGTPGRVLMDGENG